MQRASDPRLEVPVTVLAWNYRHLAVAALLAYLLGLAAGCGGHGTGLPAQSAGESPGAALDLPRPSEIPRAVSAPPTDGDLYRPSGQKDSLLPSNRVSAMPVDLMFTPDWDPGDYAGPEQLAYAGYRFTNLAEYAGMARIKLNWLNPPPDFEYLWLAVANFSTDAWQWQPVPSADLVDVPNFSDCISGAGELYALVLLGGTSSATLQWILLGDRLSPRAYISTDLNPDKVLNVAPLTVNFSGQASFVTGGEITAWDFDFEDDGTFDEIGNNTGLTQHVYTVLGATTCRLRVHDDIDQQAETTVDFWVVNPANIPPTALFTATPNNGSAPLPVSLDASTTTDDTGIRRYEWDLDGDGTYETDGGTEATLNHILGTNGFNNIWLRVTDLDYATATHHEQITVAGGFKHSVVASGYLVAAQFSAGVSNTGINERACVAWQDYTARDLKFSVANDGAGSTYAAPVDAAPAAGDVGFSPSMINDGFGYPMIAYGKRGIDGKYDLEFVHATQFNGSSWDGPYTVNADDHTGGANALTKIYGVPAIVSVANHGYQGECKLYYYRAAINDGSSWNSGIAFHDGPANGSLDGISMVGAFISFFEVPVVSFWSFTSGSGAVNQVGVMRANEIEGTTWNPPTMFDNRDCRTTSLAIVAGRPALAGGSYAQGGKLYYGRAGEAAGDTWPDGFGELLTGGYGGYSDLKLVSGNPAICFYSFEGNNLWYMDAADVEGTSWNDPYIIASSGIVGEFCSMAVLHGDTPVIFYYDNDNDNVMAAYWIP